MADTGVADTGVADTGSVASGPGTISGSLSDALGSLSTGDEIGVGVFYLADISASGSPLVGPGWAATVSWAGDGTPYSVDIELGAGESAELIVLAITSAGELGYSEPFVLSSGASIAGVDVVIDNTY